MKKVSFYTLGCKLNQAETAVLAEQFKQKGFELVSFGEPVDVCVINTCTVTGKSDYRCRQMVRKARHSSPTAKIAVVGCYAQLYPDQIKEIEGVDFILGSDEKFKILDLLNEHESNALVAKQSTNETFMNPKSGDFYDHTRAFLKIQDGCDNFCSYCAVPLARGRSRSDSIENITRHALNLVEKGHKEIVITGVHIGRYGEDLEDKKKLVDVIHALESIDCLERIRLSSLEPLEVDDKLLETILESKKVCNHFHIPLQSGDTDILKRMNRNYTAEQYYQIIKKIENLFPDSGLGTDVIVGFPCETEDNFHNTQELIEELPFTYLHVFSYSARPGTAAYNFNNCVNPKEIKRRSEILRAMGRYKKLDFLNDLIGKELNVLWEEKGDGNWMFGFSSNYVRVRTELNKSIMNKITRVKISAVHLNFVHGEQI